MIYLEFDFEIDPPELGSDILLAELSEIGFESFVEKPNGLLAYVEKEKFKAQEFERIYILKNPEFEIDWSKTEVEQQNWNEQWEKSFSPITIGGILSVRAPFHTKRNVDFDIVIEPKMSFGTGHHETTYMMLQHILNHDFNSKQVLDMGCGTGVLAILSEMKGAAKIDALDIDPWSFENSRENVKRNQCKNITVLQGDSDLLNDKKYDVILANINRNVLMKDLPIYVDCLNKGGALFMSGFYQTDLNLIGKKCESLGLSFEKNTQKGEWISVKYVF